MSVEFMVDSEQAAKFLGLSQRQITDMARRGEIPAHPVSGSKRMTWRFKLSELSSFARLPFSKGMRIQVREGWDTAGRAGTCLGIPVTDRYGATWAVVEWDDEDDPDCFKLAGLQPLLTPGPERR